MKIKRWWTKQRLGTLASFIAAALVLLAQAETARAQWTGPDAGNNIYYNSGNVGIGTNAPSTVSGLDLSSYKILHVFSGGTTGTRLVMTGGSSASLDMIHSGASANQEWFNLSSNSGKGYIRAVSDLGAVTYNFLVADMSNGNVGIGTTTPADTLVLGKPAITNALRLNRDSTSYEGGVRYTQGATNEWYFGTRAAAPTSGLHLYDYTKGADIAVFEANSNIYFQPTGNVGIGTSSPTSKLHVIGDGNVTGNLTVGGNIAAKYQDVAEWVPSSEQIPSGTVVVLDPTKSNQVISSTQAYDTRVAGVVSEQPGIALGESGAGKVLVATTGRVRVRVDATKSPIHIGDLLVTSEVSGAAMKSEPIKVGGRLMHMPGTLIGKALEPLEKGSGKILVLLSLQ
ncbi:MAG: hypothetical protein QOH70_644 [Blastocatellia bacterium]|jgi:hypothetical protein|nr:hypothetical protein [Blastocatellia bacterium]